MSANRIGLFELQQRLAELFGVDLSSGSVESLQLDVSYRDFPKLTVNYYLHELPDHDVAQRTYTLVPDGGYGPEPPDGLVSAQISL